MKDLDKIRDSLYALKLKTRHDINQDISNLDSILNDYVLISKLAKDLITLRGKSLQDALTNQGFEYYFFRTCAGNLSAMLDYFEELLKTTRGRKFYDIQKQSPRDMSDRAINQLIDGKDEIFEIVHSYLKVKEVREKFSIIVDSYVQRAYAFNNITRAMATETLSVIL